MVGAVTRLRRLPVVVCALAELGALLLFLNTEFASAKSACRVLPTWASLHQLRELASLGLQDTNRLAPPATPYPPVVLLTVAGIGVAAVAIDLIAVRLRRPAMAGLPLLVLFCVPLDRQRHQGAAGETAAFCLGMSGYLALLAADGRERLRLWGRLVTVWQRGDGRRGTGRSPDTKDAGRGPGRRIGWPRWCSALFVPLLVPGLAEHKLFASSGTGDGPGGREVSLPNPLVQMNSELHRTDASDVLSYRTTDPDPQYLQVYVLNNLSSSDLDADAHRGPATARREAARHPRADPSTPTSIENTTITLAQGLSSSQRTASFLPLPYPARTVNVGGGWRVDPGTLTLFSGQDLSGMHYSVTSREVDPSEQQLQHDAGPMPASITSNYLSVPRVYQGLTTLAEKITRGQTSSYGQAVALQRWFADSGKFTYSLNVQAAGQPAGADPVPDHERRGYCQQFAFAMAVLARLLDIPSRVAVGYTAGTPVGHDRWVVKTSDAHAWPELYFQGVGWLRFEPTPAGSGGQATAIQPTYTLPPVLAPPSAAAARPTTGTTTTQPGPEGPHRPAGKLGEEPGDGRRGRDGGHAQSGAVLAAGPGRAGRAGPDRAADDPVGPPPSALAPRRRRPGPSRGGLAELQDDLTDYQVAWSDECLAAHAGPPGDGGPADGAGAARGAQPDRQGGRAGPVRPGPADSAGLRDDTDQVRRALAGHATWRVRWRARLLPAVRAGAGTHRAAARHGHLRLDGHSRPPPRRPSPPGPRQSRRPRPKPVTAPKARAPDWTDPHRSTDWTEEAAERGTSDKRRGEVAAPKGARRRLD